MSNSSRNEIIDAHSTKSEQHALMADGVVPCRYAPFPKNKMSKLLNDVQDAKALLAEGR